MEEKKNILTYQGLRKYEDELHDLKVVKRQEVAQKIKEAREQGDLSENAEYDAAKDEQNITRKLYLEQQWDSNMPEKGSNGLYICRGAYRKSGHTEKTLLKNAEKTGKSEESTRKMKERTARKCRAVE